MPEKKVNKIGLVAVISLFTLIPMGVLGAFLSENNRLTGFAWGIGIGIALFVLMGVGTFGWEWIKKEADEGKLRPYMLGGLIVAVLISGWFAWGLGDPTCIESTDTDNRGSSCIEYADDGYEATSGQRWEEFWNKLPVTLVICLLVAYIVHSGAEKNRTKHFRSKEDEFSVGIFPETISVDLNDDGNNYKYKHTFGPQYTVFVTRMKDLPMNQKETFELLESWHTSAVTEVLGGKTTKVEYEEGEKQKLPYLYGSYQSKKDITYYQLTLIRFDKVYELGMYIKPHKSESTTALNKIFFEFVDSFKFIKN